MKILKVEVENYKGLRVFEVDLNGENLNVAGDPGTGKTTAISILWDIIKKVGDPLAHGKNKGRIKLTLGDGNKKIFAERKFTEKTNSVIIMTSEGEKVSVKDFEKWYCRLGINPHKIVDMKPTEQVQTLLNAVDLPKGVDLLELDTERENLVNKRKEKGRVLDIEKKRLGEEPKLVKSVDVSELLSKLENIGKHNRMVEKSEERVDDLNDDLNRLNASKDECHNRIEKLNEEIKKLNEDLEGFSVAEKEINQSIKDGEIWLIDNQAKDPYDIKNQLKTASENNELVAEYDKWFERFEDIEGLKKEYEKLDGDIKDIDKTKKTIMDDSKWPIDGISISDGNILYNDCLLTNHGKSKQMLVCGALAASSFEKNDLKVVRMDGIESMSASDFSMLTKIFNNNGIQVLSSRVARNDLEDNEITIKDGVCRKR